MSDIWDQARIEDYIKRQEPEGLQLEYKGADALGTNDDKRNEITKDVSALANSAGGKVIFGISTYKDKAKKHLPEHISPIDASQFSVEWLGQKIGLIHPRIEGIAIHSLHLDSHPTHVVYVVEIPKSTTAHQATDLHYYKRYDARSIPMQDYEIRDVMGRSKHPKLHPYFTVRIKSEIRKPSHDIFLHQHARNGLANKPKKEDPKVFTHINLMIRVTNLGAVYAQYVTAFFEIPEKLLRIRTHDQIIRGKNIFDPLMFPYNSTKYRTISKANKIRDIVDTKPGFGYSEHIYGPSRYEPILPSLSYNWSVDFHEFFDNISLADLFVRWSVYVDNAPMTQGQVAFQDIAIIRKTVNDESEE